MSKFHPLDVVLVKEYGDMVREFGTAFGRIKTRIPFVQSMRYLCGQRFTIGEISEYGHIKSIEGIEYDIGCPNDEGYWYISEDMLELVSHRDYNSVTNNDLKELLFK